MAADLRIRLLGPVEVSRRGTPVEGFESRKALALLCYLALQEQAVSRPRLAELFWEGRDEEHGRGNLSRVLHNLTHLLPYILKVERHRVHLPRQSSVFVDAWALEEMSTDGGAGGLVAAAELCRGELMAHLDLDESPDFGAWLAGERERWQRRQASVLGRMVSMLATRGRYEEAGRWGERWLALDPLSEEAHRQLMLLFARQGQRSAALSQFDRCRALLAEELEVEPEEETRKLYERLRRGGAPGTSSLPAPATPFVGREEDLDEIRDRLLDPTCRLLTLTGPGGIGKTRLALEAARLLPGTFLDGVCFVPLSGIASPALLFATLAVTLSLPEPGDPRALVLERLPDREMLLILDSFEHLVSGGAALAEILAAAPKVKLLVTSRTRLDLPGEWVRDVNGLPSPPSETATGGATYSAVRLFLQSARREGTTVPEDGLPDIIRLCRRVEGMPLAIELAAGWVRERPLADIAKSVETGLDLLARPAHGRVDRQRSVRASFEHSWRLLSDDERRLFERLSLFSGGVRRRAADEVAGATPDRLSTLVRSSFLRWDEARHRFTMHDLLRHFGEEKLRARGEAELATARDRFCRFFTQSLAKAGPTELARDPDGLVALTEELDNVRAAWTWAIEARDAVALEEALEPLWGLYELRGWYREGEEAFGRAAAILDAKPATEVSSRPLLRAQILSRHAWFLHRVGFFRRARERMEEAGTIPLFGEDPRARAELLFVDLLRTVVALWTGRFETALATIEAASARCQEQGDALGLALLHPLKGLVLSDLGAFDEAAGILRTSAEACKRVGDERRVVVSQVYLAAVESAQGHQAEARRHLEHCLEEVHRLGDQIGIHFVNDFLGLVACASGDPAEAVRFHEEALRVAHRVHFPLGQALSRAHLGCALAALGRADLAEQNLRAALPSALEREAAPAALEAITGLGHLAGDTDPRGARRLLSLVAEHPSATAGTKARTRRYLANLGRLERRPRSRRSSVCPTSLGELVDIVARLHPPRPLGD